VLARGVFAQAIRPPTVPAMTARLRLAVMATHREEELAEATRTLGAVARSLGIAPRRLAPLVPEPAVTTVGAGDRAAGPPVPEAPPSRGVFDFEAPEPVRRAA
jgi:hypothetical protein